MPFRDRAKVSTRVETWLPRPAPVPLSLGPAMWLDASDTSTITASSNAVSQWDDKSGNGKHVSQATASRQPTTATNTLNGLNVLYHDGTDGLLNPSGTTISFSGGTIIGVFKHISQDGVLCGFAGTTNFVGIAQSGNSGALNDGFGSCSYRLNGATFTGTRANLFTSINTTTCILVCNSTNASGSLRLSPFGYAFSPDFAWEGDNAEFIVFSRSLSGAETTTIEQYLSAKWNISI